MSGSKAPPPEPVRVRLALAVVAGCAAAASIYAIVRVAQSLLSSEPDPALVIWSEHAGYFWRAWIAAYAGGMVAFVAYVAAGRDAVRTSRALAKSLVVASALALAQGILVP